MTESVLNSEVLLLLFFVLISGGSAGLMVCLFAKFKAWRDGKRRSYRPIVSACGGAG